MKKLTLLLFSFLMISGSYFSQLDVKETTDDAVEIGETKIAGYLMMGLKYYKPAEKYLFRFKNMVYPSILDIKSWWMNEQSKNELYELLLKKSADKSKDVKELEIKLTEKKTLKLKTGYGKVQFWLWDGYNWSYSQWFKMKKIDEVFGKVN